MIDQLNHLINDLREELTQYGEMLALLEQQQEFVIRRQGSDLLQSVSSVDIQGAAIRAIRARREESQRKLAVLLQQPEDIKLADLAALAPAEYRPLVEALVRENNQLLVRVQQRARQNQMLLSRSLELMQQFIKSLLPSGPPIYGESGSLTSSLGMSSSLYEAVG